ncbi:MAG: TIGR03915 family putative DNA repair protein [Treponema sp.]|jgi:hypothetical protein|nr:TIGR03915 family putative DNA repair protein [Treponema sp.]
MEPELVYDGTLEGLFALLDRLWTGDLPEERWPRQVGRPAHPCPGAGDTQGLLFDEGVPDSPVPRPEIPPLPSEPALLHGAAGLLFRLCADAYDALVCAWLSGLPLEAAALRYALRVLSAAKWAAPSAVLSAVSSAAPSAGSSAALLAVPSAAPSAPAWYDCGEARRGAAIAAWNRLDDDCRTVLAVSHRVAHEIDRLMGFLRFSPDSLGRYLARCSPDYFVLPALASHFSGRFGDRPWAILDEKRGLALIGEGRGETRLIAAVDGDRNGRESRTPGGREETWEELWQSYHRTISIKGRENVSLQRSFVPLRYRDYLNEFASAPVRSAETAASGETGLFPPADPEKL